MCRSESFVIHFSGIICSPFHFPLFKYNEDEKRWDSEHHPFTSPKKEDIALLADKLVEEQEKTGVPNHTPIVICKKTGTIFSGNFRVRSAKSKGIKKLKPIQFEWAFFVDIYHT